MAQQVKDLTLSLKMWVQSLAWLSELRIWCFCKLWHRSQMWLRPGVAMAVVYACSFTSSWTPNLGTSICPSCGPKKKKRKKKIS